MQDILEFIKITEEKYFIVYYGIWCMLCYLLYRLLLFVINERKSLEYVDIANITDYQILILSYLRYMKAFVYSVILDMLNKKNLILTKDNQIISNINEKPDDDIKMEIWKLFLDKNKADNAVKDSFIEEKIKPLILEDLKFLKDKKLIISDKLHSIRKKIYYLFMIIFFTPGLIKLAIEIYYERSFFLIILELVVLFGISFFIIPQQEISHRGLKALKLLRDHYKDFFQNIEKNQQLFPSSITGLRAAGLFGIPLLFMFPEFSGFTKISNSKWRHGYFHPPDMNSYTGGCSGCTPLRSQNAQNNEWK